MTYGKLSDRCLKVFVVLLIAGVWAGSVCPILWKQSPEAIIPVLSHVAWCRGLAAPVLSADFKPQGGELALAKLIEAGYFDTLVN